MKVRLTYLFLVITILAHAQNKIRISGVVVDLTSNQTIEGVTIINKSNSKGAVSDSLGFYSMFSLPGDSIQFVDIRYKNTYFVVPPMLISEKEYGMIQVLERDEMMLEELVIFPFPTAREFNRIFLSVVLPKSDEEKVLQVGRDMMTLIKSQYEDDKTYYSMWANRQLYEVTGEIAPNNFINPANWSKFFYEIGKK
jgi:hypothetical protein